MPLRLYVDMDSLDHYVVGALRSAGIDVLTSPEAGNERALDERQVAFATAAGRAVYTANRADFARIHKERMTGGRSHAGIIVRADQRMPIGDQIRALRRLCEAHEPEAGVNLFEYLEDWL